MAKYSYIENNQIIKIVFDSKPSEEIRNVVKNAGYRWKPTGAYWCAEVDTEKIKVARKICGEIIENYGLKVKLKDIISADDAKLAEFVDCLKDYVEEVNSENGHPEEKATDSQIKSWQDCFEFIKDNLAYLSKSEQDFELIFEYSLPGTAHKRPDVFLLTDKKVISLEFKRKGAPQIDEIKDDVAQAIRYKEYLQNHHEVTRNKNM